MKRQAEFPPAVLNALLRFLADGMDESGAPPPLEVCVARFPDYVELVAQVHRHFTSCVVGREAATDGVEASAGTAEPELLAEVEAAEVLAASIFEAADTSSLVAGAMLGPYRLERELGRGAQGWVWLAVDTRLGRSVALKTFHGGCLADPVALRRFEREARLVSRLEHPGICNLYEAGTLEGVPFLATRYIEGRTLASALVGVPADRAAQRVWAGRIARMARALHVAHEAGIVHRDVKPSNVILDAEDQPVLLDFGLARAQLEPALTLHGSLFGTPPYMAPEQCRGEEEIDRRVDIHALGVILHQALAGVAPFAAATPRRMIEATLREEAPDLTQANLRVPRDLAVIASTAMARDPRDRYATAATLAEDLERWLDGRTIAARPLGRLVRCGRWIRREPTLALALGAFLLSTSIGTLVSLRALRNARVEAGARERALDAEREARRASERSLFERDRALRSEHALRLAAESLKESASDPTTALELALRAFESEEDPSDAVVVALHDALNANRELAACALSTERILELAFLSDEELLCLDEAGVLRRWRWRTEEPAVLEGPPLAALAVARGRGIILGGRADGRLRWLDTRGALVREQSLEGAEGLKALSFDPRGERLFALTDRGVALGIQCADGALLWSRKLRAPNGPALRAPRFGAGSGAPNPNLRPRIDPSPSGALVLYSDARGGVLCLRSADGEELARDSAPRAILLSEEELFATEGAASFHVRTLDASSPQRSLPRTRIERAVTDLAVAGAALAIGSQSGDIELWYRDALVPYAGLRVGAAAVRRLAFDGATTTLAAGCDDGSVHVYDALPRGARCEAALERIPRTAQVEPCAFLGDGAFWHLGPEARVVLQDPSGRRTPRVIADPAFAGALAVAASNDERLLALLLSSSDSPRGRPRRSAPMPMRLRIHDAASGAVLAEKELAHAATELLPLEGGGWLLASDERVEHRDVFGDVARGWSRTRTDSRTSFVRGELVRASANGRRLFCLAPPRSVEELLLPEGSEEAEVRELPGVAELSWVHAESGSVLQVEEQSLFGRSTDGVRSSLLELEKEERVIECAWLSARTYLVWTQRGAERERSLLRCFELPAHELWQASLEHPARMPRTRGARLLSLPAAGRSSEVSPPLVVRLPGSLERRDARSGALLWRLPLAADAAERVELDPSGTWICISDLRSQRLVLRAVDPGRLARRWLARLGR